ncbi:hypothetical protein [Plesiocystis pacifica]|uniref:hypothetical protein n=1 Tax=Plesiocystis pacifica TaxID=191768 RepID=UPI0012F93D1C|nr:hypothetical protein [Plesiocystis pacifica]
MSSSFLALEPAAASGESLAAVEVLLDALEAGGALGTGGRVSQLRSELAAIARQRLGAWTLRPEVALVDLYARTLHLPELADARARWAEALDARGPWLQPTRPWPTDARVLAQLDAGPRLPLERLDHLRFEGEEVLIIGLVDAPEGEVPGGPAGRRRPAVRVDLGPGRGHGPGRAGPLRAAARRRPPLSSWPRRARVHRLAWRRAPPPPLARHRRGRGHAERRRPNHLRVRLGRRR